MAAGALALSLVRLLVFAAGGIAALAVASLLAPALDEPLVCALVGGLVGIIFYRLWITALTSLVGTLLLAYCGLCLGDRFLKFDTMEWSTRHAPLIDLGLGSCALLGIPIQYLLERRRVRKKKAAAAASVTYGASARADGSLVALTKKENVPGLSLQAVASGNSLQMQPLCAPSRSDELAKAICRGLRPSFLQPFPGSLPVNTSSWACPSLSFGAYVRS